MDAVAELIRALAALAWPAVAAFFLWVYKPEVVGLLRRLRRGSVMGQTFELDQDLERLDKRARAAEKAIPPPDTSPTPRAGANYPDAIESLLADASSSPKLALIALSARLERSIREILASSQDPNEWEHGSLAQNLRRIELPPDVTAAVGEFRSVRNRIVHGHQASDEDAIRAIDSGLTILRALEAVPREIHVVEHPNVEVFADAKGEHKRPDVHGVVLESRSSNGSGSNRRVFPTTRTHFQKGKSVAWEWSSPAWSESWYRDPDTGELEYAWTSAMQFVGRHLENL